MTLLKRFTETFHKTLQIDVHQHLWPEPLLAELGAAARAPAHAPARRELGASRCRASPTAPSSSADHDPDLRAELVRADGLDRAYVALSCPLGIEALPPDAEAGRCSTPGTRARRRCRPSSAPGPLPASANPTPPSWPRSSIAASSGPACPPRRSRPRRASTRCGPLLEVLERRGAPLFVHPGPAPGTLPARVGGADATRRRGGRRSPATWPR